MSIQSKPGDEFVRHAEPVEVRREKMHGGSEWFVRFQLDGQTLYVGLQSAESLSKLGAMIAAALKGASKR